MARELTALPTIPAAGGVLWRPAADGYQVAVVHRPKYDDWSLPKGKLQPREHVLLGAAREVAEETGHRSVLGRPLGRQEYLKQTAAGPVPKAVDYWSMRASGGRFTATEEVDELAWVSPAAARGLVTMERDRSTLAAFAGGPRDTVPFVIARHGSAGERDRWTGPDRDRPLDAVGRLQAAGLGRVLEAFGVRRVLTADVARCFDTVAPYAEAHGGTVRAEPLFSESGFAAHPEAALDRLLELLAEPAPTVLCSQGKVIPYLLPPAVQTLGAELPAEPAVPKGAFWVLHLQTDRLVAAERHGPALDGG